jgi:hypothetical protein
MMVATWVGVWFLGAVNAATAMFAMNNEDDPWSAWWVAGCVIFWPLLAMGTVGILIIWGPAYYRGEEL